MTTGLKKSGSFLVFPLASWFNFDKEQPEIAVSTSSLVVTRGDRMGLEFCQRPIPRELLLLDLSGGSLGDLTHKVVLIRPLSELAQWVKHFP